MFDLCHPRTIYTVEDHRKEKEDADKPNEQKTTENNDELAEFNRWRWIVATNKFFMTDEMKTRFVELAIATRNCDDALTGGRLLDYCINNDLADGVRMMLSNNSLLIDTHFRDKNPLFISIRACKWNIAALLINEFNMDLLEIHGYDDEKVIKYLLPKIKKDDVREVVQQSLTERYKYKLHAGHKEDLVMMTVPIIILLITLLITWLQNSTKQ